MKTYVIYHRSVVMAETPEQAKELVVFRRQWPQEESWTIAELPQTDPLAQTDTPSNQQ